MDTINENHNHYDEVPAIVKWIYAIVLFGAAVLIYLLFKKIVPVNIYVVYLSLGVIVGLSVVLVLHLILRKRTMHS